MTKLSRCFLADYSTKFNFPITSGRIPGRVNYPINCSDYHLNGFELIWRFQLIFHTEMINALYTLTHYEIQFSSISDEKLKRKKELKFLRLSVLRDWNEFFLLHFSNKIVSISLLEKYTNGWTFCTQRNICKCFIYTNKKWKNNKKKKEKEMSNLKIKICKLKINIKALIKVFISVFSIPKKERNKKIHSIRFSPK